MSADAWIVFLAFGRDHLDGGLNAVETLAARLLPGARVRTVIVDNALAGDVEIELHNGRAYLSGDNASREFSGWDRGLAWLRAAHRPAPDATLLLANDTFQRADKRGHFDGFTPERAAAALARGALVGWVDAYPRPIELFGVKLRQWIDTSVILGSEQSFARVGRLAAPFADEDVFAGDHRALFRAPSPLSENYRAYLRAWLFGDGRPDDFAETWYGQEPLGAHNFAAFKGKLRSIFCEHLLSGRAQREGLPIVDVRADPLVIEKY
jgi:hypothetical protein